jgi:LacI family transcriptional regulator
MVSPVTITQIAEAAGVGTATVDRVLNNRSGVNAATVEKVRLAMVKLGASAPARGRPRVSSNLRFGFVLPSARRGFFDLVDRVIAQAAGDLRHQHITEVTHRLAADEVSEFASKLTKMTDFDGLAVLAPDVPAVKLAINELVRSGVHVVCIFSDVPGALRETYIGVDNRAAGRTAGILLGNSLPRQQPGRCLMLTPVTRYAAEIDRSIGFSHLLEERFPHIKAQILSNVPEAEDEAYAFSCKALKEGALNDDLQAIHIVSVGSWGIARALQAQKQTQLCVAAYDLIEMHKSLLLTGELTYVLHQDIHYTVMAAAKVLRSLCDGVRGALSVPNPRVEIATAENLA